MNKKSNLTGFEIAVIGMAGRFPGAKNIGEFWENLKNGVESIIFLTDRELLEAGVKPDSIQDPDYVKVRGGELADKEMFDEAFFGYTPAEAEVMDPQLRIFHECCWQALEDAGYNPYVYDGLIGLYAGSGANFEWQALSILSGKFRKIGEFTAQQLIDRDFFSTRVSYKLNLKGPAVVVQSACSTSLVAIHMACRALLTGECDMALAGGSKVIFSGENGYLYQEGMIGSPDGRCRAFDAASRGCVGGSGIGIVVLKRLKFALRDGDNIQAVIKGSAINNDGSRKVGFNAPSIEGQAEAVKKALHISRAAPESISYIEAHGTGTVLGDPIEIQSLIRAFDTDKKGFCRIGSVKTNIGHIDSAAGAAGFIKTVLILKHRVIPPSLNFETPNPKIDFENSPFRVNDSLTSLEKGETGEPSRAAVNSLGFGGTNAFVILEEWQEENHKKGMKLNKSFDQTFSKVWPPAGPPEARNETPQLITLSAKTQPALDKMSRNLTRFFEENPGINLADAAYTLQVGRAAFAYRRTVTATSAGEIIAAFSPGSDLSPIVQVKEENKPVVFMFPGQGTQYVNMGLDLYKTEPVFREEMERCFEILKESGLDIKAILYPEQHSTAPASGSSVANSDPINNTAFAQPLIFAVQYALAKLLMSWGIKPYAMTGHSIGEYTAACLSGVFSLEDALALVAERGKLMQRMPAGDMLSVSLSKKELTPLLSKHKELSLAAENSPSLCVVSGPAAAIGFLSKELEEKEYKHRLLHTSHAFHSAMMEPVLKDFAKKIAGVKLNKPQIPYISNVTGTWITVQQAADPGYWTGQLRQTVRFAAGLTGLLKEKQPVFLEVGAGRVLSTFAHQHEEKKPHHLILHLIRGPKESESLTDDYFLLSKIGRLWQEGIEIDRQGFYAGQERKRVSLPVYAFERRPYWTAGSLTAPGAKAPAAHFQADSPKEEAKTGTGEGLSPAAGDEASLPLPAAPGKKTEAALLTLWQDFFGVAEIGPRDDFFEIGGDSLKAMTLISHIHKVLNIKVPLTDFFAAATIKKVAEFIDGSSGSVDYSTIEPVEKKEYYPVSPMQGRMLFLNKMDPSSVSYNLSFIHVLDGNIDEEKVKKIFQRLTGRHESFRVCFEIIAGEPVQRIHDTVDFDIEHFEINHSSRDRQAGSSSKQEQDALIDRTVRSFIRPFDLSKAPLLRAGLIKINEAGAIRYILMLDMHHIISDGISNGIFFKELMASYRGEELPPLRIQYKDYTEWYNKELDSGWMKSQETYWLDLFKEEPPLLDLPTDFDRPAKKSYDGRWMVFDIEKEKIERLKALALEEKATMFMVFLAIYYVFLSKLSGQEDITVVTILTGRNHSDLEQIIGMFANTLFLRNYPARDRTFREFLHEVRDRILAAYENQDYQTDTLVDKIVSQREQSRNPISDVSFMLLDFEGPRTPGAKEGKETQEAREVKEAKGEAPAPQVGSYDFQRGDTLFDLSLILGEIGERMFFRFEYSTKLFKRETIIRFEKYFKDILDILLENKDIKLIDIQLEHDLLKAESNIHEMDFEL